MNILAGNDALTKMALTGLGSIIGARRRSSGACWLRGEFAEDLLP